MRYYHKINTLFNRDMEGTKKLIEGSYSDKTYELLKDVLWIFTEKIDGTNVRITWDGNKIGFGGKSEVDILPIPLMESLENLLGGEDSEQMLEQMFRDKNVILFGEGYGGKIQNGNNYGDKESFILFDIYFADSEIWAQRSVVEIIAKSLNLEVVPIVFQGTLEEGIAYVKTQPISNYRNRAMEGIVAKPLVELKDNQGKRIIAKIKVRDFVIGGK